MISPVFDDALQRVRAGGIEAADLVTLLAAGDPEEVAALHAAAYAVKRETVGPVVSLRGLIEWSNRCTRNCLYCGIRRDNAAVRRYSLGLEEIVAAARRAHDFGYGSIVLQGGERQDAAHADFVAEALRSLHAATGGELGVTLSLGEQDRGVLRRWRDAGAHRYLLRIETSDREMYARLHPDHPDWEKRRRCLDDLRAEGYQVGTGVMIGLPGQSLDSLARDILFYRDQDVDMIGMGPYIPHADAPLGPGPQPYDAAAQVRLALNVIACTRLVLPDVNIASTTALQALDRQGRERGLRAGANVMMPNVTDPRYRDSYHLYDGKPAGDEDADDCRRALARSVSSLGERIAYGQRGDSPRARAR